MNLSPEEVRERLTRDLGARHEPSLDVGLVAARAARIQRRRVGMATAGTSMMLVLAVVLGSSLLDGPKPARNAAPAAGEAETDLSVDTKNFPPKKLVAAGRIAVSATATRGPAHDADDGGKTWRHEWTLYNPNTQTYDETPWSWLDVAPGMHVAAVLEGDLPTKRVGILDMATRDVRWIEVQRPVASVAWSPDATTLLATAYDKSPDYFIEPFPAQPSDTGRSRTGFVLIDVATGTSQFHELGPLPPPPAGQPVPSPEGEPAMPTAPPANNDPEPVKDEPMNVDLRQDLGWSVDGSMIWGPTSFSRPDRVFYDLDGKPIPADAKIDRSSHIHHSIGTQSAISPNGKLAIKTQYQSNGVSAGVVERETGKPVGVHEMGFGLLAWADDEHLISLGWCSPPCQGMRAPVNALFLVSVDGKRAVQLTAETGQDDGGVGWLLTRR